MNLFSAEERERAAAPYERLARKALAAYGMNGVRVDLVSNAARVTFRVFDAAIKTSWALQLHPRGADPRQILRNLCWLAGLRRETPARVPEPILTRTGELIQSLSTPGVSGFRQVTLSTWLEGRRLPFDEWSSDQTRGVGRTLGVLHAHAERFELPPELALSPTDHASFEAALDPRALARAVAPNDEDLLIAAWNAVRETLAESDSKQEVAGLIHGRLSPDHLLFAEAGPGVVGFGACRWGYYADDVAAVILALRSLEEHEARVQALLDGYRETRPHAETLVDRLPSFGALRLLEELRSFASRPREDGERRRSVQRIVGHLRDLFS